MNKVLSIIKDLNPFSNKKVDNKIIYTLKILLSAFIVYFASLIIAEGIIIGGSFLFGYNATDKQMPYDIMLLCTFYGYLITILLFILFTKKINKIELNKIGLDKNIKTFLKGILIGIVSLSLIIIPLLMCGAIKFNGINNNIDWLFFVLYLFGYLIQSFMEELVCRGYLLHRLKEKIPAILAITISVLFFSIGHINKMFDSGLLIGLIGIINLLLISLIFVVITLKNKNIYGAIGFHFIWNFVLFSIIGLNLSGLETTNSIFQMEAVNKFLTGYSYGIESSFITTIILIIILLLLLTKKNVRI
jgi:membrane protease YdiL (CAAX protease family)